MEKRPIQIPRDRYAMPFMSFHQVRILNGDVLARPIRMDHDLSALGQAISNRVDRRRRWWRGRRRSGVLRRARRPWQRSSWHGRRRKNRASNRPVKRLLGNRHLQLLPTQGRTRRERNAQGNTSEQHRFIHGVLSQRGGYTQPKNNSWRKPNQTISRPRQSPSLPSSAAALGDLRDLRLRICRDHEETSGTPKNICSSQRLQSFSRFA